MGEVTTILHPIFADCVAQEKYASRYSIAVPFVLGGYWWATNGKIIVRTKTDEPDTPQTAEAKFPDGRDLGWPSAVTSEPIDLPALTDEMRWTQCTRCNGEKSVTETECPECLGDGEVTCAHCGDGTVDCDECDGRGKILSPGGVPVPCEECAGEGRVDRPLSIPVGKSWMGPELLSIVVKHGCKVYDGEDPKKPFYFTFDGGDGLLMPRRAPAGEAR